RARREPEDPILPGIVGHGGLTFRKKTAAPLEVDRTQCPDADAGDWFVGLVEHAARDEAHLRQREIDVVGALTVREIERLALLERTALAVAQTQISAARDTDVVAA